MENQNYPVSKHSLMYGIYISVVLIILSLVFYVMDLYTAKWTSYLSYAVLLAGIVLASLHYRDNRMGGFITYKQSFTSGFMAGLFASLVLGVFTYIFSTFLGDELKTILLEQAEENMLKAKPDMTDDEIDMGMKIAGNMMKPLWMALLGLLNFVFFSLVFSLIASIFIKKTKPAETGV